MKVLFATISILFLTISLSARDTVYYYSGDFSITSNKQSARYMREVEDRSARKKVVTTFELQNGEWNQLKVEKIRLVKDTLMKIRLRSDLITTQHFVRTFRQETSGNVRFVDRMGKNVVQEGTASSLIPLHRQDTVISYYPNRRLKSIGIYDENGLISNKNWLKNGDQYFEDLHHFVDKIPEYSLGQVHFRAYMLQGINESELDITQVSDNVVIGWVVMEDGSLEGFHVISGVYTQLNNLLIKLIKEMSGTWIPATVNGKPVRYHMTLPFNFIDRTQNFENVELKDGMISWF